MRKPFRRALLISAISAGLLLGCSAESPSTAVHVRDSAGVRIVELPPMSEVPARFGVSDDPVYRVGWHEGDHEFEDIVAGGLWADGRAVVGDGGRTLQIVVLSATGSVDAILGGPGQGPGELGGILAVLAVGDDAVWVQDNRARRLTVFRGADVAGTLPLGSMGYGQLLGTDPAGEVLMGPPLSRVIGRRYETPWLSVPLVRVEFGADHADTLAWADWDQSLVDGAGNNPFMSGGFATVANGQFVVGRGDRPEIRWLDERGRLRQIARWRATSGPVPATSVSAWEVGMRAAFERAERPQSSIESSITIMKEAMREPLPHFGIAGPMPPFGGLMSDLHGNVWIPSYLIPRVSAPQRYHVMSPQGEWLGWIEMPEGFRLLAVGMEHVLGVERNALDVHAAALYAIIRP